MKLKSFFLIIFLSVIPTVYGQKMNRQIAVTIDDLPVVSKRTDLKTYQQITIDILKHITEANVPAIGFVNEFKLYKEDKRDETQVDLLRMWLDANLELGNHTFSHKSPNRLSVKDYQNDILRGEIITKELLTARGLQMRYFRHPYLLTGKTIEIKQEIGSFLQKNNYTIAPVTLDNEDYFFASALDNAVAKNNTKLIEKIGRSYVTYMETRADYWERQSVKLFGREIKQILLIHANSINAKHLGEILQMFRKRGYTFITLEEALKDEAYLLPETDSNDFGTLWLYRWATAKGKEFILPNEPTPPAFILKAMK
jgi:peptidoglycan/xylan/chitin deacetylase (PgdA/CDA1 family)